MKIELDSEQVDFLHALLQDCEIRAVEMGRHLDQKQLQGEYRNSPQHPAMKLHGMVRSIMEQLEA